MQRVGRVTWAVLIMASLALIVGTKAAAPQHGGWPWYLKAVLVVGCLGASAATLAFLLEDPWRAWHQRRTHQQWPTAHTRYVPNDARCLELDLRDLYVEAIHISILLPSGEWINGMAPSRRAQFCWLDLPNQEIPELKPGRYRVRWYAYGGQLPVREQIATDSFMVKEDGS